MKEALINVEHISKKIRNGNVELTILKDINFSIQQGEMVAITGKSGCGKSTLLSILAGLDAPTTGEVLYKNENLYQKKEQELEQFRLQNIGLVFQNYNLIPELTCMENIKIPLIFSKAEKGKEEKITTLLEKLELQGKQKLYPAQLSGGEQQRVAIARAIINEPMIVYLDEPTGSLDSKNANNIIQILENFRQKQKATIVLVTHDKDIANQCDRKLVMVDGKMV